MNKYRWPLATDPFTLWDRLKICWFLLDKRNMLTMGPKVAEFEEKMYSDCNCAPQKYTWLKG